MYFIISINFFLGKSKFLHPITYIIEDDLSGIVYAVRDCDAGKLSDLVFSILL